MSTKERIVEEALTLFSSRGYQGTSVKNIAEAVGIKDSSLYKHFKSKKEIFETIVEEMARRMEAMSHTFGLPDDTSMEEAAIAYGGITEDELVELSKKVFLFYLQDPFAGRFRRMLTIEQYRDQEIAAVYRKIYMEDSIRYQTVLFGEMIRQGVFSGTDARAMAVNFYAPIFFLLNKYDGGDSNVEDGLEELERQVREFVRIYQK